MVFPAIIALFFGFLMVTFGLIIMQKINLIVAALAIALFGFFGSQRIAHERTLAQMIVGGICAILPLWAIPYFAGSDWQITTTWPLLVLATVAIIAGIVFTARRGRHE